MALAWGRPRQLVNRQVHTLVANYSDWPSGHAALATPVRDFRTIHRVRVFYKNTTNQTVVITPTPQLDTDDIPTWEARTALTAITLTAGNATAQKASRLLKPIVQDPAGGDNLTPIEGIAFSVDPAAQPTMGDVEIVVILEQ